MRPIKGKISGLFLLAISTAALLAAGELTLRYHGYEPAVPTGSFAMATSHGLCEVESEKDAIERGLFASELGNLHPDPRLGYTGQAIFDNLSPLTGYAKHVLVLGDSFAQGLFAVPGKGIIDHLREFYRGKSVTFDNLSFAGYSQTNQLAIVDKHVGAGSHSSALLFAYPDNDIIENLGPLDRHAELKGWMWVTRYEAVFNADEILIRKKSFGEMMSPARALFCRNFSPLRYLQMRTSIGHLLLLGKALWRQRFDGASSETYRFPGGAFGTSTENLFQSISGRLARNGIQLRVVIVPSCATIRDGQRGENQIFVAGLLGKLQIPHLDIFEGLGIEDYGMYESVFSADVCEVSSHWNNAGHLKAAGLVRRFLDSQGDL